MRCCRPCPATGSCWTTGTGRCRPSRTQTTWNAEVLVGDAVDAVAELKDSGDGTLVKYGNGPFSRALVEAGLLGEVHLGISPLLARAGGAPLSRLPPPPPGPTGGAANRKRAR